MQGVVVGSYGNSTACELSVLANWNGYAAELVYLEVSLKDVQARMVRNKVTAARAATESDVFERHVGGFEPPQADEVATVLRNAASIP